MPRNELIFLVAKLKDEVQHFRDDQQNSRDQIESLISDLESHLAIGRIEDWPEEMVARVREELETYETEHPQITGILNSIMVTLGSMGI